MSRPRLYDALKAYGNGIIITIEALVTTQILSAYFATLEEGFDENRIFKSPTVIGLNEETWVFSNKVLLALAL